MIDERKNFNNYKEVSILIMLIPMLFILIDTLGRMNSKINNKNLFEVIFNEVFVYRELIVKFILIIAVIFIVFKIKVIKEKFILGDLKVIIGYTILGIIIYKFFGSQYGLSKSLDAYIMCIISMILILSGISDTISSVDNISINIDEKSNFEKLVYARVKYLGVTYFIIFSILIAIENINSIMSSRIIINMVNDYNKHYNHMARIISVLGIAVVIILIFMIRKSFYNLNLCHEEYIYIIKHKTFTEEIKKEIDFVNLKVESSRKYFNNKFKKLDDKKAQVLLKGIFDMFKDKKH
ncbi:hypothetical protein FHH43_13970 [Clostridium perfringens]|nr:hypothetical protein [Clostridium perfringens]